MRNWSNLPTEVLEIIFDELQTFANGNTDLSQCQLTCKSWKNPAQRFLYGFIEINHEIRAEMLINFFKDNENSPTKLTKKIYYNFGYYHNDGVPGDCKFDRYLPSFIKIFPFVEHIDIFSPNDKYYTILITARQFSQLKHLKIIASPRGDSEVRIYVDCALAFRSTLNRLYLCNHMSGYFFPTKSFHNLAIEASNTSQYNRLVDKLDQFPQLRRLKIEELSDNNDLEEHLDHVVDSCPELDSISLTICPPLEQELIIGTSKAIDLTSIIARPNITYVKVVGTLNNDNALLYIMHKFPNAKTLKLCNTHENPEYREIYVTSSVAAKFLSYIVNIPTHRVTDLIVAEAKVPEIFSVHYHSLLLDRSQKPLVIQYYQPAAEEVDVDKGLALISLMTKNAENSFDRPEFMISYFPREQWSPPHLELIKKVGHFIKDLKISLICEAEEGENIAWNHIYENGSLLCDIFKYCKYLDGLELDSRSHILDLDNPANNSVKHLNLKKLTIRNALLHKGMAAQIPALKILSLINCYTSDNFQMDEIDMEGTTLGKLHWRSTRGYTASRNVHFSRLRLSLDIAGKMTYYICEDISPKEPIQVSEHDYRLATSMNSGHIVKTVSIQCQAIDEVKIDIFPYEFVLHPKCVSADM